MRRESNKTKKQSKMKFFFELGNYIINQILRNLRLSKRKEEKKNMQEKLNNSLRTISETPTLQKIKIFQRPIHRRRRQQEKIILPFDISTV